MALSAEIVSDFPKRRGRETKTNLEPLVDIRRCKYIVLSTYMHPSFLKEGKSAVSVAIGFIAANYTILPCPIPKARRQPVLGKQFKKPSPIVQICFLGTYLHPKEPHSLSTVFCMSTNSSLLISHLFTLHPLLNSPFKNQPESHRNFHSAKVCPLFLQRTRHSRQDLT